MCSAIHAIVYLDTTTTLRTATQPDDILHLQLQKNLKFEEQDLVAMFIFQSVTFRSFIVNFINFCTGRGLLYSVTHAIVYITQIRQICYTLEHYQTLYLTLFSINLLGNTTLNFLLSANTYTFLAYYHF